MATLGIRINTTEHKALKAKADSAGISMGALLKATATGQAVKVIQTADPQLLYQISSIGNNLNQITRAVHTARRGGKLTDKTVGHLYAALVDIDDRIAGLIQ